MAKKTLLSPPEAFFQKRSGEFLDPGISIPVPQVSSPEERASMEAEFERRSRAAEIQAQGLRNPAPHMSAEAAPQIVFLPVKDLEVSPWNARPAPLDGEALQNLRQAISLEGIKSPLHAYLIQDKPGRYAILDGQRRLKAALSLGLRDVPVILHEPPSPEKAYMLSYMLSQTGEKPGLLDNALMWGKLLSEGVVSLHEELALLLGVSRATITRTLQFFKLSPECQNFLLEHREKVATRSLAALIKAEAQYGSETVNQALQSMGDEAKIEDTLKHLSKEAASSRYRTTFSREPIVLNETVVGMIRRAKNRLIVELTSLEFDEITVRRVVEALKSSLVTPDK